VPTGIDGTRADRPADREITEAPDGVARLDLIELAAARFYEAGPPAWVSVGISVAGWGPAQDTDP